jgi:Sugar-transfer associated ATP-grasp
MSSIGNLLRKAFEVRRTHGVGLARQVMDILRLTREPGRLGPAEYYDYRVFSDSLPYAAKRQFLGWRGEARLEFLNQRSWHALANDKLAFSAAMAGLGIPLPRTVAIFHDTWRYFGDVPCFGDATALANFLRANREWPLFAKPVQGAYGKGTALIEGYDPKKDALILAFEPPRPVDAYVGQLQNPGRLGFMFQEVLAPHPALVPICGPRLSSVRVMTLYPDSGARLHRVIWKIPVGANITDNYQHGAAGNLIAAVDPESGISREAVLGIGLDRHVVERHPDTGAILAGFELPQWEVVKDVALRGTRGLPGLRWQHWDIAFAREGPTALEVNLYAGGGTDVAQVSHGYGLLDDALERLVRGAPP